MKLKKLLVVLLVVLTSAFVLAGCDDDSTAVFNGTYTNDFGDLVVVTETEFSYYYSDGNTNSLNYEGTFDETVDLTDESGRLVIEITDGGSYSYTVDYFMTVSWKNLKKKSVSFSTAYNASGTSEFDTASGALAEHTEANGYFGYYSDCSKQ